MTKKLNYMLKDMNFLLTKTAQMHYDGKQAALREARKFDELKALLAS